MAQEAGLTATVEQLRKLQIKRSKMVRTRIRKRAMRKISPVVGKITQIPTGKKRSVTPCEWGSGDPNEELTRTDTPKYKVERAAELRSAVTLAEMH